MLVLLNEKGINITRTKTNKVLFPKINKVTSTKHQ